MRRGEIHSAGRRFAAPHLKATRKRLRESHAPIARSATVRCTHFGPWLSRSLKRQSSRIGLVTVRSLPLLVGYEEKPSIVKAMAVELGLDEPEQKTALDLFEAGFPPLTRRDWMPFLFGVSPKLIGAMSARPDLYYRRFKLRKRSGGYREIVTPRRFLKTIQRWILHNSFHALPVSDSAHGFIEGRNIFTNAIPHLSGRNVLAVDIQDFFPSVSRADVLTLLRQHLPFSHSVASQVAGLCTLDGILPQGAPTSPRLANAAFSPFDAAFEALANDWGCAYTRYADDIAFSGERQFTRDDVTVISGLLADSGFNIQHRKTRIVGSGSRQIVAGIVVNHAGLPPRETRRRWRAMFHRARHHPTEFGDRGHHLLGVASFVKQYSPELAARYEAIASDVLKRSKGELPL